jgi:hypothetical protein
VLRDAATVRPGDEVKVTLARGELDCEVRSTREGDAPDGKRGSERKRSKSDT